MTIKRKHVICLIGAWIITILLACLLTMSHEESRYIKDINTISDLQISYLAQWRSGKCWPSNAREVAPVLLCSEGEWMRDDIICHSYYFGRLLRCRVVYELRPDGSVTFYCQPQGQAPKGGDDDRYMNNK